MKGFDPRIKVSSMIGLIMNRLQTSKSKGCAETPAALGFAMDVSKSISDVYQGAAKFFN